MTSSIETMFAATSRPADWTEDEERDMIRRAQAGDESATEALLRQYVPAMKSVLRDLNSRGHLENLEDARQSAMLAVLEVIHTHDADTYARLAGRVVGALQEHVLRDANNGATSITVPKRTLSRFFHILREADGNVFAAAGMAPAYSMTRETFLTVYYAVLDVQSFDAPARGDDEGGESPLSRLDAESVYGLVRTETEIVEDEMLVRAAFQAVDTQEEQVIRHSYGFMDYEAQSDAEVAHRLGLSRPKVQRVRSGGLAKMRYALGVA